MRRRLRWCGEFALHGRLHDLFLRFLRFRLYETMQVAACNGIHSQRQQFARWLLQCSDRLGTRMLEVSQSRLAEGDELVQGRPFADIGYPERNDVFAMAGYCRRTICHDTFLVHGLEGDSALSLGGIEVERKRRKLVRSGRWRERGPAVALPACFVLFRADFNGLPVGDDTDAGLGMPDESRACAAASARRLVSSKLYSTVPRSSAKPAMDR